MLSTIVLTVHVLVALTMIFVILFQQGKGANIGATFGGSSQTLFGPRGGVSVMAKITTGAAILFMITSITLSVMAGDAHRSSIIAPATVDEPAAMPTTLPTSEEGGPVATESAPEAPATSQPGETGGPVEAPSGP